MAAGRRRAEPGGREFLGMVTLCMAMAAMSIDLLLPAFPEMRRAFGLAEDATEISRVITAFLVGLGLGQLVYGPLSDRFGRKPLLYVSVVVFVAGAVGSTMVDSLGAFVACRFVWGFGAAGPRSLALVIVRDTYEGERMARAMSYIVATFILVPILAPGIGAGLIAISSWQVVLWVPVVVALLLVAWTSVRLPETLSPERRRSASPAALREAAVAVVRNRQTMAFCLAVTCSFAILTSYIGSAQLIVDEVFGQEDLFPLIFGLLAVGFALGSLLSAQLVMRVGLDRLLRVGSLYMVAMAIVLATVGVTTDGHPPLWLFMVASALMLPSVTALIPNLNTAAMAPLPHVAGMAAALIGTISTAGGALLGSVIDSAYDGSVKPFTMGALALATGACVFIWLGGRPAPVADVDHIVDGEVVPALLD